MATDKPLTKNIEAGRAPFNFKKYTAAGGYESVHKVVKMEPTDAVELVKNAGLGGRGGAGALLAVPCNDALSPLIRKVRVLACH